MVARRPAAEGDASERQLRTLVEALQASEARLAEAERLAGLGSWTWECEGDTLSYSAEMYEVLGRDPGEGPVGLAEAVDWTLPEDRARVDAAIQRVLDEREPFDFEYRIVRPDGEVRWIQARAEVTDSDGTTIKRVTGFVQDITARREAEHRRREARDQLAHHHEVLRRIARGEPMAVTLDGLCREIEHRFEGARCSVLLVDADDQILRHAAAPTLPHEVIQALDGLPVAVGMGACGTSAARKEVVVVEDTFSDSLTAPFLKLAADHQLGAVWSQPLLNPAGDVLGTFALYRPGPHSPDQDERDTVAAAASVAAIAIERALAEAALTEAANVDALTRLPNRNHFLERLDQALSALDTRVAVMFLDLDRFKWINDSLGHPTGDRILVEVAARLRRVLREGDIVARFGGDEFTILVNDADLPAVEGIAGRLESAFTEPFVLDGGEFFLSVSVGIAVANGDSNAYGLIRDADAAMYSAKEGGRARHAMFDDGLRQRALARVTLETELRRGIEREEFELNYQPIRDLRSGDWAALEALVRWHHPTRGLLDPDEFIPLAEETGLIVPLGQRLIDRAVRQVAILLQAGTPIRIAVNLSVVQLSDPAMPDELQHSLRSHDVPAALLVVEITETGLMQRLDAARGALEQIANLGVSLVIDDFGTGYSSIARLGELPVMGIKVDRSFTQNLGVDPDVGLVLGAITDLAHALDLRVIAEGVETAAALATASDLGCDYAQGYYLARPAPANGIALLLR